MIDLLLCVRVVVKTLIWNFHVVIFGKLRQRILLKCVTHVQHDYFSSFNQSDHCFIASWFAVAVVLAKAPWYENFTSSFGRLREKSVSHVQHDYISSFTKSNHWFVALSLPLTSSFLKLPISLTWRLPLGQYCDMTQMLGESTHAPMKGFRLSCLKPRI